MLSTSLLLELTRRYSEPHRSYHNLQHVAKMLQSGAPLGLGEEQVMAIWFHDVIYQPGSATNEEESAELAASHLADAGWQGKRTDVVKQIILDTKNHLPTLDESRLVIDLDLETLAGSWTDYQAVSGRVRAEFSHVNDEDWTKGRGAWLSLMLAKERLFWTAWGQPLEVEARANLTRDLDRLTGLSGSPSRSG